MYWILMLLPLAGTTAYHLISNKTPASVNPFLGVSVSYLVAMVTGLVLFALTKKQPLLMELRQISRLNVLLGLAVIGIEAGFLLMYRNGWPVSKGSVVVNILAAAFLLLIGRLVYQESVSLLNGVGIALCMVGAALTCLR